jgi:hypothetical protein
MMPAQSRLSFNLIRIATCGVLGGVLGFVIENFVLGNDGLASRWFLTLQNLWESHVTREWRNLVPLVDDEADLESIPPTYSSTSSCSVCFGLIYDSPHRYSTPGTWKARGIGWYDNYVEDMSCSYPRTCDWVFSAKHGCTSCQIVVDAVSSFSPELFKDYKSELKDLGLASTHIRAWGNPSRPLGLSICRPWKPWYSEREEFLEVFTEVGMKFPPPYPRELTK